MANNVSFSIEVLTETVKLRLRRNQKAAAAINVVCSRAAINPKNRILMADGQILTPSTIVSDVQDGTIFKLIPSTVLYDLNWHTTTDFTDPNWWHNI